jgi:glycerol-3-phosphate acyltransferase PlsY
MLSMLLFVFLVATGYLFGSICSAIIISRIFGLPDPRSKGSQNPGATNVLRLAGKKFAVLVLFGDMLKGILPVLIAHGLGANYATLGFTCLAAVIGHIYPIFFNFKGGKGVATALGALLGLQFVLGVIVLATWLLIANFSRYSSLASIISIILAPLYAIASTHSFDLFPPIFFITGFILYQHRNNINRLMAGEEPKIRFTHHHIGDVTDELLSEPETDLLADAITKKPINTTPSKTITSSSTAKGHHSTITSLDSNDDVVSVDTLKVSSVTSTTPNDT